MRAMHLSALMVMIVLLVGGCDGMNEAGRGADRAPDGQGDWAYLYQSQPGAEPNIRLHLAQPSVPLREQIFAWLFYRAEVQQHFSLNANRLVDVWFEPRLGTWDDTAAASGPFDVSREFPWRTAAGDEETVSVQFIYYSPALQPGVRYYHRVQRVVEPMERAGSGAPIVQSAGVESAQIVPLISVDPWRALSEGSAPTRGVTYIRPVALHGPPHGAVNQSANQITFTWNATAGANEYLVQVFPGDDPSGQRQPRFQRSQRVDTAGVMSETISGPFAGGARFYWRVGARRAGDPLPVNGMLGQAGWLFSEIRTFTTAPAPPPLP